MEKSKWQWGNIRYFTLGCLVLIGGFFLFLFRLNHENLSFDESWTWAMTNFSFIDIIKNISAADVHPPLYHLLLKTFCLLGGNSLFVLRLFSVLGALALAALGLGPVRRICGAKTGLLYSGLIILTPIVLSMSQEARMYTWLAFFVTGTVLYAYLAATDNNRNDWIMFGLFTTGAAYTHYYGLLAVIITSVFLFIWFIKTDRPRLRPFLKTIKVILICYLPCIPLLVMQMIAVKQDFWIGPVKPALILNILYYTYGNKSPAPQLLAFRPYAFWLAFILTAWGLLYTLRRKQTVRLLNWFAMGVYLLTIIIAFVLSYLYRPILIERYIIAVLGLFVLSLAIGLSCFHRKSVFWSAMIVLLAFSVPGMLPNYQHRFNGPINEVVSYVKPNLPADSVLVHLDGMTSGPLCYYFPNHKQLLYLPNENGNHTHSIFRNMVYGSDLDSFLKGRKNIWIISAGDSGSISGLAASHNLAIVSEIKQFELPYSWFRVSVSQVKHY